MRASHSELDLTSDLHETIINYMFTTKYNFLVNSMNYYWNDSSNKLVPTIYHNEKAVSNCSKSMRELK